MMKEFNINYESLRSGTDFLFNEQVSPLFIDLNEKELSFKDTVDVEVRAYLAEEELIVSMSATTFAEMPCVVCSEITKVPLSIKCSTHSIPLSEIPHGVYNFEQLLREDILLECPQFAECHEGQCPERENLKKYFKKPAAGVLSDESGAHIRPFENLLPQEDDQE